MLTLAGHIFGCIFWGLLIALVFCGITYVIAQGISGKKPKLLLIIALLPFILWQTVLGVGAVYARSYIVEVEEFIEKIEYQNGEINMQEAAEEVHRHFPAIPEKFIDKMSSDNISAGLNVAKEAAGSLRSSLNRYLLARLGYSLLFMVAGTFLLVKTAENSARKGSRSGGYHGVPPRERYFEDLD